MSAPSYIIKYYLYNNNCSGLNNKNQHINIKYKIDLQVTTCHRIFEIINILYRLVSVEN